MDARQRKKGLNSAVSKSAPPRAVEAKVDDAAHPGKKQPCVFLDRDGTLIVDVNYGYMPSDIEILPEVPESLALLKSHGFLLIAVTNQSGVARSIFNIWDIIEFHRVLDQRLIKAGGVGLDGYYFCPYHKDGILSEFSAHSHDRKPETGMLEKATAEFNVDLKRSHMIGDRVSDVECGRKFGISSYLFNPKSAEEARAAKIKSYQSFAKLTEEILRHPK